MIMEVVHLMKNFVQIDCLDFIHSSLCSKNDRRFKMVGNS